MKRLAIITTHPIQYNAPLFQLLQERKRVEVKVFYTWGKSVLEKKYDPGFQTDIQWDIPLLEGYDYAFIQNVSRDPGSHHFRGIDNPGLTEEVKKWKPDSILVYGWSFKSHLKLMRYFKGKIPVLFRGDSTLLQAQNGIKILIRKIFLRWVYSHIDQAIFVGTHNKQYYKSFGLKEAQLLFAPHAIDNKGFYRKASAESEAAKNWRESLGIKTEEIVFLYAGKLDENKNTFLLAESFKRIKQQNCHLILVGNGSLEAGLKEAFRHQPRIHFISFQNQSCMPLIYSMADVFVLPSINETWGLSINEAMACGKAVLVSNTCGAAIDLVKENVNGFTFQSNNLEDLVEKMMILSENRFRLSQMGKESLKIIGDWSYEKDCEAIEYILS